MNKLLFYMSARLFGEACIELYIERTTPDGIKQVYLTPRPGNDPFYPNLLHLPGARKIPTETDLDTLMRAKRETPFTGGVIYLFSDTYFAKRGTEYADVRKMTVPYNPKHGNFYDVENLPDNIISHHVAIIKRCLT